MKLLAPIGTATIVCADGSILNANADGTVDAPASAVPALIAAGFSPVSDAPVDPTTLRPVSGLAAGSMFFDSTLGKPIWRNAANSGWVDATGAAV